MHVVADDQCTQYQFRAPFYPGSSCEDIYNMNPENRDRSCYKILDHNDPSNVYYGDIYKNNPEMVTKMDIILLIIPSGSFMNAIAAAVADGCIIFKLVWEEDREELHLVMEMNALLDGARVLTMVLASVEYQVIVLVVTQHSSLY